MKSKSKLHGTLIGVDLGAVRTGIARIHTVARIPEPLEPISDISSIADIVRHHDACAVVAGTPRGLDGQDTAQTKWAKERIEEMRKLLHDIPVFTIDEAGTTKEAEVLRQKPTDSVDSLAAGIMLVDFLNEVERGRIENVTIST